MKHSVINVHYQSQTLCRNIGLAVAALQQQHCLCGHCRCVRRSSSVMHTHCSGKGRLCVPGVRGTTLRRGLLMSRQLR